MARVVHFEIPASDPGKLISFYESVFDWTISKWDGPMDYWMVKTGDESQPGINGGLVRRHHEGQPVVNTVEVPSVDEYVDRATRAGGQVAVPKMAIPGVGWLAYITDPEGNVSGLMQPDPSAA